MLFSGRYFLANSPSPSKSTVVSFLKTSIDKKLTLVIATYLARHSGEETVS
jgi:hypothetical protein